MSAQAVSDLLYHDSRAQRPVRNFNDMRDLLASKEPHAALAIAHFVYRCGLNAGLLAAALGGLDAFVFTAGIGENSPRSAHDRRRPRLARRRSRSCGQ